MTLALVALGAALGAPLRYLIAHVLDRAFPTGTLLVNITGSFALGLLIATEPSHHALALWGTGFCGGYTTYSSFAVQSVNAGRRRGSAYVALTIVGCTAAAFAGLTLG